ncbi:MAG TPA: PfkB family carbohydrate kinase [Solirubrobacteraceae bacterium]|nr:PfkB family carbohydrate kinase [Solirubrobacteraceae bacterium]
MSRLIVIGDALLDRDLDGRAERLAPDAPVPVVDGMEARDRAGGAGLAAAIAAADGHDVALVCALGDDPAGARVRELLEAAGVRVLDLGLHGATPEKVRVRAGGRALVRLDHGGESRSCGPLTAAARAALAEAGAILVSDYGRGVAAEPTVREALAGLGATPLVWDPHPKGPDPVPGCTLVTPNASEAGRAADGSGGAEAAIAVAPALRERWSAVAVAVTLGERGAVLCGADGPPLAVPAPHVASGDPCGAGDCFAATAAGSLASGALPSAAVRAAVGAASAFVGAGGAAGWSARGGRPGEPELEDARALAARVREQGGTVVATGGCFDLLHAGHVHALQAARALGDCLIVCLNSDASVRRLKGPERPLVGERDRAAVLEALACVDAVAVFGEDDPRAVLRALRPHVWAKGGDYAAAELPEAATLAEWGGHAVVVPYVAGRSTTRLIEVARAG